MKKRISKLIKRTLTTEGWLLVVCLIAFAEAAFGNSLVVNCGSTNLGTSYTTSPPSANAQFQGMISQAHLMIQNGASVTICADTGNFSLGAPASGGVNEHCALPGSIAAWDFVTVNTDVYLRAVGSSCTSNTFTVDVW